MGKNNHQEKAILKRSVLALDLKGLRGEEFTMYNYNKKKKKENR
jgi:hypothetical protein